MSEELEALNYIKNGFPMKTSDLENALEIIEIALKELEVKREVIGDILSGDDEKKLKALEIIKEKRVIIDDFITCSELWIYNQFKPEWKQLTKEEFDLLKEVLL